MKIITNNHFRDLLYSYDLTKKELKEFDYMNKDELEQANFFRYRGTVYNLSDFVMINHKGTKTMTPFSFYDHSGNLKGWDGILTDSFFSAIVIAYDTRLEAVKIGLYLS